MKSDLRVSGQPSRCLARLAIACVVLLLSSTVAAAKDRPIFVYTQSPASRVYADLQFGLNAISLSGLDFFPKVISGGVGVWLFDNIGVEIHFDGGIATDSDGAFTAELEEAVGLSLRFQSPPVRGLAAYINVGVIDFQLVQVESDSRGTRRVSEGFGGARISLGVVQRLPIYDFLHVTGEYRTYLSDSDLQVDTLAIGLRINLK